MKKRGVKKIKKGLAPLKENALPFDKNIILNDEINFLRKLPDYDKFWRKNIWIYGDVSTVVHKAFKGKIFVKILMKIIIYMISRR